MAPKKWNDRKVARHVERLLKPMFDEAKFKGRGVSRSGFQVKPFGEHVHVFYRSVSMQLEARNERDDMLARYKSALEDCLPARDYIVQLSERPYKPQRILISSRH